MGWERKRGKLEELNALLRGSTTTGFLHDRTAGVDAADGRALRGHARRRHAAAARRRRTTGRARSPTRSTGPTFDPRTRPGDARATASSSRGSRRRCRPSTAASIFQRIFSGSAGIDPYASAVSDVYQDLFGEGSFTGKGIYDVDAFERGDGRPRAREHAAEPRSVRGRLRPRRAGDRRRAVRRVPVALPGRRPPASTAGRAATGSSCRGSSARARRHGQAWPQLDPRHRPLEDGRQPAPDAVGAARGRDPRRRVDAAGDVGRAVDGVRRWRRASSRRRCRSLARTAAAAAGHLQAQPPARASATTSSSPRLTSVSASRCSPTRRG